MNVGMRNLNLDIKIMIIAGVKRSISPSLYVNAYTNMSRKIHLLLGKFFHYSTHITIVSTSPY